MSLGRRVLLAGASTLALAACLDPADDSAPPRADRLRALLERWFGPGDLSFMAELGALWAATSAADLESEFESAAPGPDEDDDAVLTRWRQSLDQSFASDDLVVLRGYGLGRTEAQLCLLAASLD